MSNFKKYMSIIQEMKEKDEIETPEELLRRMAIQSGPKTTMHIKDPTNNKRIAFLVSRSAGQLETIYYLKHEAKDEEIEYKQVQLYDQPYVEKEINNDAVKNVIKKIEEESGLNKEKIKEYIDDTITKHINDTIEKYKNKNEKKDNFNSN